MRRERVLDGAVIRASNDLVYSGTGPPTRATDVVLKEGRLEIIRQGYWCPFCMTNCDHAYDCVNTIEKGYFCKGFTPEDIRVYLGAEFRGNEELWPHEVVDLENARREKEEWMHQHNFWLPPGAPDAA
jgi:hypothetical protein